MILEKDIENMLVRRLKKHGGLALKFTSPGTRAVPDRIIIYGGLTIFVELKAPNKKLRVNQVQMGNRMLEMGAVFVVIDSFEKIDWLIEVLKFYAEALIEDEMPRHINAGFLIDFNNDKLYQKWVKGGDAFHGSKTT